MISIELANEDDAQGIHDVLLENLIEIEDINEISSDEREKLESQGFLRKEVGIEYYLDLIREKNIDVYIAKENTGRIVGFATIHKKKYDVRQFRSTISKIYTTDEKVMELLTDSKTRFAYLDQISVIREKKRSGIGTAIFKEIIRDLDFSIVSFIVEVPLANIASAKWHEHLGFDLAATCDGEYKGKKFKWWIYIYWIN